MKDEIKEILDSLDFNINHTKDWVEPLGLNQDTWKKLFNYITNLQEEKENQAHTIKTLLEENKELKKEKIKLYKKDIKIIKDIKEDLDKAEKIIEDDRKFYDYRLLDIANYKSIIDKAIDKLYCYGEVFDREILKQFQKEMLDILGDKNE